MARDRIKAVFDSHCHLDFPDFEGRLDRVLDHARGVGVERFHVPGCGPTQWAGLEVVRHHRGVGVAVGVHPWWVHEVLHEGAGGIDQAIATMEELSRQLGVEAIGECGLDRPHARGGGPSLEEQSRVLEAQLALACDRKLPVVLHVVGSHGLALEILKRFGPLPRGGIVHGYSGSADLVREYVGLGFALGFGCGLLRDGSKKAQEALRATPPAARVFETDCPDGRPERARPGEPADLLLVLRAAAKCLATPLEQLARASVDNAERVLGPAQ